jgi:hypothetical protein
MDIDECYKCKNILNFNGIKTPSDFRKWSLRNHSDKGYDDELFRNVSICKEYIDVDCPPREETKTADYEQESKDEPWNEPPRPPPSFNRPSPSFNRPAKPFNAYTFRRQSSPIRVSKRRSRRKSCKPSQYRNPSTKRCKSRKPCKKGQRRSRSTKRCRSIKRSKRRSSRKKSKRRSSRR